MLGPKAGEDMRIIIILSSHIIPVLGRSKAQALIMTANINTKVQCSLHPLLNLWLQHATKNITTYAVCSCKFKIVIKSSIILMPDPSVFSNRLS